MTHPHPSTTSAMQQLAATRAGLEVMLAKVPPGWRDWSSDRTAQFMADTRAARSTDSLPKLAIVVARLLGAYGLDRLPAARRSDATI